MSSLSNEFAKKLELVEARRFDSDRRIEHRPERPVKSVKPLEQSLEVLISETPSPQPPPINEAYLQVAESVKSTLQGLSTLFELLYQRTQIYPFDSSLEALPSHVKKWTTDVPNLHSTFKNVVLHCRVMMPELLKRLSIEENKVTWCDSQLEELNNAWCVGLCQLLVAMDSICGTIAYAPSPGEETKQKLCGALEQGCTVIKDLDKTFATRWAVESRFPTATKRICCVGTATSHCLSRLVEDDAKRETTQPTVRSVRSAESYNPFDETSDVESVADNAETKKLVFSSIGVDTSDLVTSDTDREVPSVPANSSSTSLCSKSESISDQLMMDSLKARVSALESEKESHLVDLSLLRRKLANLGGKEAG
ncbi:unnamed protein product [Nippostrongylus brasiliensis]|uniref:CDT1 domain-containing protein n=1 Tax=Nippostrongylus brasiliensis TaxID=27835 RepID=A0A0N4XJT5_NIPBR|nr:unnamed protein product [Nippostrongylus brasiliensis]